MPDSRPPTAGRSRPRTLKAQAWMPGFPQGGAADRGLNCSGLEPEQLTKTSSRIRDSPPDKSHEQTRSDVSQTHLVERWSGATIAP